MTAVFGLLRIPALALVVGGALAGCVSTDVSGRHVTRLGPLRAALVHPASASAEPLLLDVGRDVLDDAELERMKGELSGYFGEATARIANELAPTTSPRGIARVQRCSLSAAPTRRATVYVARCRVALFVDDVPVVEVEASAERRARARAVTEERAAEIRKLTRNPLLDYDDSRQALESALEEALRLLVSGAEPNVNERDPTHVPAAVFDQEAMRADALRRLSRDQGDALAAACIDLGRFGTATDGLALAPHIEHESALVRRACATSIGELGAKDALSALEQHEPDPDPAAAAAIQLAKERLRALYPDLPPAPSKPSNSSTEGGGV